MRRVVVIGGGIAGLATAFYLQERARAGNLPLACTLVESSARFGGKITSARERGFVIEGGPDSFLTTKPAALELCRSLGLGEELIGTNDPARRVFVWSRGRLRMMPEGVMLIIPTRIAPFVKSSLISWPGKIRMGMDLFIPPRPEDGDESLAHFVRRRLGAEALDKIAEPMVAGIYVADAEDLSLTSTFPRFLEMEKEYGGLLRGVLQQRRASNGRSSSRSSSTSTFMTLRGGLQELVDSLVSRLDPAALFPNRQVIALAPRPGGYTLKLSDNSRLEADSIVLATPAFAAADLLESTDPLLGSELKTIRYVSTATVSLGYSRAELTHPLDGFGFVVPRSEHRKITACTWSSAKFDCRAPEGLALVRAFIGGAQAEPLAEQDDETLVTMAREELQAMMGISATPVLARAYRWPKGNPQYAVGHQERVTRIEQMAARHPGLYLVGAAYHGVGIPDCIQDGIRVAEAVLASQPETN